MRYGRQRWRLRGRVEVSNKQIWDSEEYIFLPLVTELLSIKVVGSACQGQSTARSAEQPSFSLWNTRFCFCSQGDGAEEPGQSRGGGERVLRNARPFLPAPPNAGRGHQRPWDGEAEFGGHLEVLSPTTRTSIIYTVRLFPHSYLFFSFSVRLIKMTRYPPAAPSPNGCCPIRALLTRPPCGSRCFMWVAVGELRTASHHSTFAVTFPWNWCHLYCPCTGLCFSCFPTSLSVAGAPARVRTLTVDCALEPSLTGLASTLPRGWMLAVVSPAITVACMNAAVVLVAV